MPTTQTVRRDPPFRDFEQLPRAMQYWFLESQRQFPLRLVDTSGGPYSETLEPAGLTSSTAVVGETAQNREAIYIKTSADASIFTINGAIDGPHTLTNQYDVLRFKSNGTSWYPACCGSGSTGGGSFPAGANIVAIQNPAIGAGGFSGSATSCVVMRIPAGCMAATGTKIKVSITFDVASVGNFILSNSVTRRTLPGDVTFTDTSNLEWSGTVSPTFNTSATKKFTSDSSPVMLDSDHDTYIILRVNPASGGLVLGNVFGEVPISKCSGETTGVAYDTVAAIPNLATLLNFLTAQADLISSVVIGA